MNARSQTRTLVGWLVVVCAMSLSGCSIRSLAINSLAGALADSAAVYASDPDPELVRDALPFALKTFEALLVSAPENQGLLLSTCSGFTQYAYAFVEADAAQLEFSDYPESRRLGERALELYLRARDYCLRALELDYPEITERLMLQPEAAAAALTAKDLELVYWTAASWGAAISVGVHRLEVIADLPAVRALFDRALELDETYSDGALHEALISLDALPEAMGGSRQRAEQHFERALVLSRGLSASPYVGYATSVLVPAQERAAFRRTLEQALAVDPDAAVELRLANHVARARARFLLDHADDFFLEPLPEDEP
ncbi:MAG: TRAP transporter TatT component family protein [Acidobacteria bacterium]|nr:TRAP transporter TatT component family protein [Acidobacteriota bacterium]